MVANRRQIAAISFGVSLLWAGAALAQAVVVQNPNAGGRALPASQLAKARPYLNPLAPPSAAAVTLDRSAPRGVAGVVGGGLPGAKAAARRAAGSGRAYGSFGIPYTSTPVELGQSDYNSFVGDNFLSTTYPYSAIGKLTFTTGSGPAFCSASVIRRGVIVTAAHCVQGFGSGATMFTGFVFIPGTWSPPGAFSYQIEPYDTWTWKAIVRSNTWANGTDVGSGAARENDLALIALNKNGSDFVGDLTGRLGYGWNLYSFIASPRTGGQKLAATSTFGYPALLDGGNIMQRVDGPTLPTTVSGAKQLWQGSNFTAGSSGGPWVVNFRPSNPVFSGGAGPGSANLMAVSGVTSWGTGDPNTPRDNYSSQFGQNTRFPQPNYGGRGAGNIGALMNALCIAQAGGGQTYAQAGYCD